MRKCLFVIGFLSFSFGLQAQAYFSFYQLRELLPQAQSLQPAYIPENTLTIGLPMNGGALIQGDFKLQDLLTTPPGTRGFTIDFDVLNEVKQASNNLNLDVTANLFHIGFKTKLGAFSTFLNARAHSDLIYGEDLMEFFANGNANRLGETLDFSPTRFKGDVFHEVGIGYANEYLDGRLVVGARVKMLTGLYHSSIDDDLVAQLTTDAENFNWEMNLANATLRTSGLSDNEDINLTPFGTNNFGLAFDLGARFKVLPWLELEASVSDMGSIKWSDQVRTHVVPDTAFIYSGIDLRGGLTSTDAIFQDSLLSKFNASENQDAFTSPLAMRTYLTASFFVNPNNRFSITYFKSNNLEKIPANYALSYTYKLDEFLVGINGSYRGANNEVNAGASILTNLGPIQIYMATDNLFVMNRPERFSKADLRFGMNIMLGYKRWIKSDGIVDLDGL